MQAFVVTFGRAGEDDKNFKLGEIESTLQGFSGADYDLNVSFLLCLIASRLCSTLCPKCVHVPLAMTAV